MTVKNWLIMNTPNWQELRVLGANRFLNSSYIWLVITPITANFVNQFPEQVSVVLSGQKLTFTLEVPFSWQVLFWAALLVSIGNASFSFYCPKIIKDFKDFEAYEKNRAYTAKKIYLGEWHDQFDESGRDYSEGIDRAAASFHSARGYLANDIVIGRVFCSAFYAGGILLLLVLFVQNLQFVVTATMR